MVLRRVGVVPDRSGHSIDLNRHERAPVGPFPTEVVTRLTSTGPTRCGDWRAESPTSNAFIQSMGPPGQKGVLLAIRVDKNATCERFGKRASCLPALLREGPFCQSPTSRSFIQTRPRLGQKRDLLAILRTPSSARDLGAPPCDQCEGFWPTMLAMVGLSRPRYSQWSGPWSVVAEVAASGQACAVSNMPARISANSSMSALPRSLGQ